MATQAEMKAYRAGQEASMNADDSDDPVGKAWDRFARSVRNSTPSMERAFFDGWSNFDGDDQEKESIYF